MFAASKTDSASTGGYQISRSLRFNSADSAYLNRTPASASNRKTWTWSGWVKRGRITSGQSQTLFAAGSSPATGVQFLNGTDIIQLYDYSGAYNFRLDTTPVYRDPSAWYHIVIAMDTTQATASDRLKLYINGTQVTSFSTATYPTQNTDYQINNNVVTYIGRTGIGTIYDFDGYQTEINLIDGQALTPSSFGETNAQTGVWQPKAYSGSYGTNGFYLNFSDNSNTTAATLGKDYSGNGNNWTPNNFSVTAGAGNDSFVDVPTPYGVDTGVGGTVRGNYCTLNPLSATGTSTASDGNLYGIPSGPSNNGLYGTIAVNSGKWYWEDSPTLGGSYPMIGIARVDAGVVPSWQNAYGYAYYPSGNKYNNGSSAYGASYTTGDVIGVALDMDAGTVTFYKNGTSQGVAFSSLTGYITPYISTDNSSVIHWMNFGQRPFAYTAPSGFKALCTQNLPTPTIGATTATQAGKFFNTVLYTGNSSTLAVTGVGFQPDWVWGKCRSTALSHRFFDAVRGVTNRLISNNTTAETTESGVTAFNSDGFTLGSDQGLNFASDSYVAWNWKANGAGSSNTAGSITSTVSANTTSGFSIVNWTGSTSGSAQTVGHGLGVTPSMVILKNRSTVDNWYVYFSGATTTSQYLTLNGTGAVASAVGIWGAGMTSTLVGVKPSVYCASTSDNVLMYCFAPIAGYSAFGSYTGNGSSDGPFVFTGFRPAYVMVKRSDASYDWWVFDGTRSPSNAVNKYLAPNLSDAENTFDIMDFTANGFKIRNGSQGWNGSGGTIIYMAFASVPTKFSLAR